MNIADIFIISEKHY